MTRLVVQKAGFSVKKARFFGPLQPNKAVASKKHDDFVKLRTALIRDRKVRKWVAIDETGFSNNCQPLKGYAPRGKRLVLGRCQPMRSDRHVSVIAAIERRSGKCLHRPVEGFVNTDTFVSFLDSLSYPPGTAILLDNVRFHHAKATQDVFRRRGWVPVFVPPYSPWFNPIENVFAWVKQNYRRHPNIETAFEKVLPSHVKRAFERALCEQGLKHP
jgi:hypothetical protein